MAWISTCSAGFCVVALLLTLPLSLTQARGKSRSTGKGTPKPDPGVIRFQFGGNFYPYDYFKNLPTPHTLTGFGVEFVRELCKLHDLNCEIIRQEYSQCWTEDEYPGKGVYDGSFDVCSGYTHTHLRETGLDFGRAITKRQPAGILARLTEDGRPVILPSENDLQGKKLALVGTWATNAGSLRYVKNGCNRGLFTGAEVVVPDDPNNSPDTAMEMLINGEVDAVYCFTSTIEQRKECREGQEDCRTELYQHLGTKYAWIHTGITEFEVNGTTLSMTKKGSPLNEFLNPMVTDYLGSKKYADLCDRYNDTEIECFNNPHMKRKTPLRPGSLPDRVRTAACETKKDPVACNSCANGFCGCETK